MADAKQGKAPEDFCNGSSQSRVVLAKPRLGGFGSSSLASSSNKSSNPFGSVLRPPQLKPTSNPFLKTVDITDEDDKKKDETKEDRLKDTKDEPEVPKFVPLAANSSRNTQPLESTHAPTTSTSSASFVFGQNLSERVVMDKINNAETNNSQTSAEHSSSNGTNDLLFTSAAASVKENNQEEGNSASESSSGSGLAAAAAEYERSHARPPPPAANFSLTGEEGETNVLQMSCRLFAWESGSWRERGRGVLRLNEAGAGGAGGAGGARLVARVAGSLRVVLNTKLWPGMVVERAATKSLRITAADAQAQIKLFLIMAAPADIAQLHRALTSRIAVSKRSVPLDDTSHRAAERLEASFDNDNTQTDKLEDADERLQGLPDQETEEYQSNVDGMKQDPDSNQLKRKEPAEEDSSPKRPCLTVTTE